MIDEIKRFDEGISKTKKQLSKLKVFRKHAKSATEANRIRLEFLKEDVSLCETLTLYLKVFILPLSLLLSGRQIKRHQTKTERF